MDPSNTKPARGRPPSPDFMSEYQAASDDLSDCITTIREATHLLKQDSDEADSR